MARQITISDLTARVNAGEKRAALAQYYGLPEAQMARLLKEAGLKIRKLHAPLYVLVDDTNPIVDMNDTVATLPTVEVLEEIAPMQEEVAPPVEEPTEQTTW